MKLNKSIQINAPASVVWHLIAHEFQNVSKWSSSVTHSEEVTGRIILEDADVSGRVCKSPYGDQIEAFTHFDEDGMTFTYEPEGQTFIVPRAANTWKVEAMGDGACVVSLNLEVELLPVIGILVHIPLQIFLRKVLRENMEELKYYVETGTVHPRKEQSLAKAMRKATAN